MKRVSIKLASLVILVACASFLVPFAVEARNKKHACPPISTPPPPPPAPTPAIAPYQIHGCGFKCSDSNDCDWPCTVCCANQTCCFEEPFILPPPPPPPSPPPAVLSPAPTPYQIHGCGYKCSDSNDCDWPCTYCCWQNQTCCNEPSFERR